MTDLQCEFCSGTGWVCENCGTRWELKDGGTCCGAGQNCDCNPDGEVDWIAVHATTAPDDVKNWSN